MNSGSESISPPENRFFLAHRLAWLEERETEGTASSSAPQNRFFFREHRHLQGKKRKTKGLRNKEKRETQEKR